MQQLRIATPLFVSQRAEELERQAARAQHDRTAERDDRDAGPSQDFACLLTTPEVRREVVLPSPQSSEIYDASHACGLCSVAEVGGRCTIAGRAVWSGTH